MALILMVMIILRSSATVTTSSDYDNLTFKSESILREPKKYANSDVNSCRPCPENCFPNSTLESCTPCERALNDWTNNHTLCKDEPLKVAAGNSGFYFVTIILLGCILPVMILTFAVIFIKRRNQRKCSARSMLDFGYHRQEMDHEELPSTRVPEMFLRETWQNITPNLLMESETPTVKVSMRQGENDITDVNNITSASSGSWSPVAFSFSLKLNISLTEWNEESRSQQPVTAYTETSDSLNLSSTLSSNTVILNALTHPLQLENIDAESQNLMTKYTEKENVSRQEYSSSKHSPVQAVQIISGDSCQIPPPPILSSQWQKITLFSCIGGTLRHPGSDVIMRVLPGAIEQDSRKNIYSVICVDISRIRHVLGIPQEETIVSPLAEYWAGEDFHFKRPVTIQLLNFLPPGLDHNFVHVYRVTRCNDGQLDVTTLRQQGKENAQGVKLCHLHRQELNSGLVGSERQSTDSAKNVDKREAIYPQHSHSPDVNSSLGQREDSARYFNITPSGQVIVVTDEFSGYVCTYCGQNQTLLVEVYESHVRQRNKLTVQVSAFVWDKLAIQDFRQVCGLKPTDKFITRHTFQLGTPTPKSKLHLRLAMSEDHDELWQFKLRSDGRPLHQTEQERCMGKMTFHLNWTRVQCDRCPNLQAIQFVDVGPYHATWVLESRPDTAAHCLVCALDIAHLSGEATPKWDDSSIITMPILHTVASEESRHDVRAPDDTSVYREMLSEMDTDQLYALALRLGIHGTSPAPCSYQVDDEYRQRLVDLCLGNDVRGKLLPAILLTFHTNGSVSSVNSVTSMIHNYQQTRSSPGALLPSYLPFSAPQNFHSRDPSFAPHLENTERKVLVPTDVSVQYPSLPPPYTEHSDSQYCCREAVVPLHTADTIRAPQYTKAGCAKSAMPDVRQTYHSSQLAAPVSHQCREAENPPAVQSSVGVSWTQTEVKTIACCKNSTPNGVNYLSPPPSYESTKL